MSVELNYTQKEIIHLIGEIKSSKELDEIKSLLLAYLADKVTREADNSFDEKGYTTEIFNQWKMEHFRKTA
jgi:hypothetical protein